MRPSYLKAAFITFVFACVLACGIAYVAAYQATSRPQAPNTRIILYSRGINEYGDYFVTYLTPCTATQNGYFTATFIEIQSFPWFDPRTDALLHIPTAPPCP